MALASGAAMPAIAQGAADESASDANPDLADTGKPATPKDQKPKVTTLDKIVVKAQKREQLLQDVPITMTTLNQ